MAEKKKPFATINIAKGIKLVFWASDIERDGKTFEILNPTLNKSWKKEGSDKWENRDVGIDFNTLYRLLCLGSKVKDIEEDFKEKQKV